VTEYRGGFSLLECLTAPSVSAFVEGAGGDRPWGGSVELGARGGVGRGGGETEYMGGGGEE